MRKIVVGLSFFLCCLCFSTLTPAQTKKGNQTKILALTGAKIYSAPTDKPVVNGIVLISNGKIIAVGDKRKVKVPKNSQVIDCTGLALTAGFWNSHVHFTESKWENPKSLPHAQLAQQLQEMLTRYGFVHVIDTGSFLLNTLSLRRLIESGKIPGPSIRTAGTPFVAPNGTPFYIAPLKLPELRTPDEATTLVRLQISSGADAVKIFSASPVAPGKLVVMPSDVAKAVVSAAHSLGKPVIAHPTTIAGINVVLESGADILAHTTPDGGENWSGELTRKLREANVALVPTLKLWKFELERKKAPPRIVEAFLGTAVEQLRAYSQAGGEILFGTDVGYMTDYDPADEYLLMEKAGMSFQQILAALTTAPAKRFGLSGQTGKIAPGMDADLVLLKGDPSADIRALLAVRYTLRKGQIIYSAN